ncbi:MAG: putative glycosyltransferase [Anaerolineales bacterium]|nr:putative glycosyltransferase [Anaerolineales bacterium]
MDAIQTREPDSRPASGSAADDPSPMVSIVAPVYNEETILPELYRRLTAVVDGAGESYELILVNDGSQDRSLDVMRDLRAQDPRVKVINFSRNFGHQVAITAGTDYARGDAVVIIDADLQDPPEVILDMVKRWREGYDVVYAVRAEREGETWFKEFTANVFYRLITRITNVDIPMDTGDFRLMDRRVVDTVQQMREQHRFMRGMSSWVGFRQTGVEYVRRQRYAGETKYPFRKMLKFAIDGITSFSYLPLQLATYFGFFIASLSLVGIVVTIILRLSGSTAFFGQASTLVSVLFLGGVQLIFLGIIGEYLGRIYDEVKGRPLYIVAEALGFDHEQR